jgi:radical SAM-linked protein
MTNANHPQSYRQRLIFAKKKEIKYIGHLDLMLAWERALRRAQIPLAYSQGFNPHPKIQIAASLPLGHTGAAEIMDIIVTHPLAPGEILERLRPALPMGLALHSVVEIPLKSPTLQHLLRQADYRVLVETDLPGDELNRRIETLLSAATLVQNRQRKKRAEIIDLRPWLYKLRLDISTGSEALLLMRLAAGPQGNLRPEEILKALDLADNWAEIERTRLIFEE